MSDIYCKESVYHPGMFTGNGCARKAKRDGYCTQHHPDVVKARRKASSERWEAQTRRRNAPEHRADAIIAAAEAVCPSAVWHSIEGKVEVSYEALRRLRKALDWDGMG